MRNRDGLGLHRKVFTTFMMVAGAGVVCVASEAGGADLVDYKVQAGDTCESIAKKTLGDPKRCEEIRAANPDIKGPTDKLKAGTTLKVPPPPPDASVTFMSGNVSVSGSPTKAGAAIAAGTEVTTSDGRGEITYKDGFRVEIAPSTTVWVLGSEPPKGAKKPSVGDTTLSKGVLWAHVAEGSKKPLVISTAAGKVSIVSGDAKVHVDGNVTRVSVHKGKATIDAGKKIEIDEGFGLKVEKGKAAGKPVKLPDAPKWTTAPAKLVLTSGDEGKLAGSIDGQPPQWHFEVARDPAFHDIVTDGRKKEADAFTLDTKLATGRYHVRVAALDADSLEGPPSSAESVVVAKARVIPSTPGKRASIEVSAGIFCGLDGAASAETKGEPIELSAARPHSLKCAAGSDGSGAQEIKVSASDAGALTVTADSGAAKFDKDRGARTITVKVVDPAGTAVEGAEVTVTSSVGTVDAPKPGSDAGTYVAALHWSAGMKSSKLHFVINGTTTYDADVALPEPPPVAKTEAPAAPPKPFRSEVAVSGGVLGATEDLGAGIGLSADIGYRYLLGPGALAMALRIGFERYAIAGTHDVTYGGAREGTPCGTLGVAHYLSGVTSTVYTIGLPITYRWGAHDASVTPYLGIIPQLVIDRPTETASGGVTTAGTVSPTQETTDGSSRFGLVTLLGVGFRASETGVVFLEAGWRFASAHTVLNRDAALHGPLAMIGYRFAL